MLNRHEKDYDLSYESNDEVVTLSDVLSSMDMVLRHDLIKLVYDKALEIHKEKKAMYYDKKEE